MNNVENDVFYLHEQSLPRYLFNHLLRLCVELIIDSATIIVKLGLFSLYEIW